MNRDDILPDEADAVLFHAQGISVVRIDGRLSVTIANAALEELTVLSSHITHCQLSGNYARHAYLSGNQTVTTYALSNTLRSAHLTYNAVKTPVTWGAYRRDRDVRIGMT